MSKMARIMGYKTSSGYQRYENPALFTKKYLPYEKVELLVRGLVGRGDPPISAQEVMALGGSVDHESSQLRMIRDLLTPQQRDEMRRLLEEPSDDLPEPPKPSIDRGRDGKKRHH